MSVDYAQLACHVDEVSSIAGIPRARAAMFVMTLGVMGMARSIPAEFRGSLVEACRRWFAGQNAEASLEQLRVACWKFLDARNGNSTTIADSTDIAMRSLICVLYDQLDDVDSTLEFFADMATRYDGLEAVLGL